MNVTSKALIMLVLALVPYSCSTKMTPTEYLQYFEKHQENYSRTTVRNGISATVTHMPSEFYVAREIAADTSLNMDSLLSNYSQNIFFVLKVRRVDGHTSGSQISGNGAFNEYVNGCVIGKRNDIFMLAKNDTVMATNCNYQQNWGIVNDDVFLISFSRKQLKLDLSSYHLIIRDLMTEIGTLDIKISEIVKNSKKLKG
jgi:hypothetical protein